MNDKKSNEQKKKSEKKKATKLPSPTLAALGGGEGEVGREGVTNPTLTARIGVAAVHPRPGQSRGSCPGLPVQELKVHDSV